MVPPRNYLKEARAKIVAEESLLDPVDVAKTTFEHDLAESAIAAAGIRDGRTAVAATDEELAELGKICDHPNDRREQTELRNRLSVRLAGQLVGTEPLEKGDGAPTTEAVTPADLATLIARVTGGESGARTEVAKTTRNYPVHTLTPRELGRALARTGIGGQVKLVVLDGAFLLLVEEPAR